MKKQSKEEKSIAKNMKNMKGKGILNGVSLEMLKADLNDTIFHLR